MGVNHRDTKQQKILVTGSSGFIGYYLCSRLLDLGHEVIGLSNWRDIDTRFTRPLAGRMTHVLADICDPFALDAFFKKQCKFDAIFHLAGQSLISAVEDNPGWTYQTNVIGTVNLLTAMVRNSIHPSFIQLSSSSDVYGDVPEYQQPIREWVRSDQGAYPTPLNVDNAYAGSKLAMEIVGRQFRESHDLNIVSTRLFTCCGPMQYDNSLLGFFSKRCALMALGKSDTPPVIGCASNRRSFIDVRDAVRAYTDLMECASEGHEAVNVAGTDVWTVGQIAVELEQLMWSVTGREISIPTDPAKARPRDKHVQIGSSSLLQELTRWKPEIPFDRTIRDSFNYWLCAYGDKSV